MKIQQTGLGSTVARSVPASTLPTTVAGSGATEYFVVAPGTWGNSEKTSLHCYNGELLCK